LQHNRRIAVPPDATSEERDDSIPQEELDETGSCLCLCLWPNGNISIVEADSKREAIVARDEWAGAEPAWLVPIDDCMIDFTLNNSGEIELVGFGEETSSFVWDYCYQNWIWCSQGRICVAGQASRTRKQRSKSGGLSNTSPSACGTRKAPTPRRRRLSAASYKCVYVLLVPLLTTMWRRSEIGFCEARRKRKENRIEVTGGLGGSACVWKLSVQPTLLLLLAA
jgi:hypothetical protein